MSLEQAIQENTKAITVLTELLAKFQAPKSFAPPATKAAAPAPDAPPKAVAPAEAPASSPAAAATVLTYKDVSDPVTKFVKAHGRDEAIAVLKPFGITRLTEAKEEQWPGILIAITKAAAAKEPSDA